MERDFIERLRTRLPAHPQLLLGIGDDAAVLQLSERSNCVVTSDLLAEGTHFQLPRDDLRRVGRKALAVNLSDIAAMAARPLAAVISLLLPTTGAMEIAEQLYEGILPLAETFDVAIAGGDTNCWNGPLVISVTLIGETTSRRPLRRDGAKAGDVILVTGELGGSRLDKQFDFDPRLKEALYLQEKYELHAGMDISDGLALDLTRMCQASGCGAKLNLSAIPIAAAAIAWAEDCGDGRSALDHALSDGEDFELLLAAAPNVAGQIVSDSLLHVPITQVGTFVEEPGLWTLAADGTTCELMPTGYEHGAS